ncbi:putative nedd8-like protein [Eutypa lata UCREL1]|uniref:Putative nedd8-like protein n=1 Tax=Eutypa lata (strain UCR-EL1) TaxID=1287681 RepID=M7SVP4_EUTLA|nr:putative nedd8-like protein [Eutypa lata UCREL1]
MSMTRTAALLQFGLLASTYASPSQQIHSRSSKIEWGPCTIESPLNIECGNITVPRDYSQRLPNSTVEIELLKVPAVKGSSKRSILLNFGGPGLPARSNLAERAEIYQAITGGEHDLIAFDPRGTASALTFSCYANATERASANAILNQLGSGNSSNAQLGKTWAWASNFADTCSENASDEGSLISTAFVARDMMQIVDALDEDGLLRYWGFSYGTALGATVSAMFPDKVDKVVLDGVLNPTEYYGSLDIEAWADTDGTFSEFFKECVKSPELCPLAQHSDSAAALEETIYNKLEELKFRPIPAGGAVIDSTLLQSVIRPSLYRPGRWTLLGGALHSLLSGDYMDFYSYAAAILADGGEAHNGGVATDAPFGIHCSDKNFRRDNLDYFLPELHKQWDQSKVLGDFTTFLASSCAQWDIEPKERYEGGFCGIKTRKPLLVVGNTFDPATSIKSAFNISAGFEDSVVLTQDGYGLSTALRLHFPGHPEILQGRNATGTRNCV